MCDVLKRFMHRLRKNEVKLRILNEKTELLIDIDHLDDEFCYKYVDYKNEIRHGMIQLYCRFKDKGSETNDLGQIIKK